MKLSLLLLGPNPSLGQPDAKPERNIETLKLEKPIENELAGGASRAYRILIGGGQYFRAIVYQQGIDVVVSITNSKGQKLAEVDRPNGRRGQESISTIADSTDSYLLEVRSLDRVAANGRYQIVVTDIRAPTNSDRQRMLAEVATTKAENLRAQAKSESFRLALEEFSVALSIWERLDDRYEQTVTLYGIGWSYSQIGENQRAIEYFNRSLSIARELNDADMCAVASSGLGWPYMYLGDLDSAGKSFSDALALHTQLNNDRGKAIALYGLGWIHVLKSEDQPALEHFSQSLSLRKVTKDLRGEAVTLTGIGKIYSRSGKSRKALDRFSSALSILNSLKVKDAYAIADVVSNIGWAHNTLSEYETALRYFDDALLLRRSVGDRVGEVTTLYGISRAQLGLGRLRQANAEIESALGIIDDLRERGTNQQLRISYLASVQDYYEYSIDLLMRMHSGDSAAGYDRIALETSERARARSFLDLLTEMEIDVRSGLDPSLLEQEQQIQNRLNAAADRQRRLTTSNHTDEQLSVAAEIQELSRKYDQIQARIRQVNPRYSSLSQTKPVTAAEIQREVLDDETVLLEYSLGKKRSFMWMVSHDSFQTWELPALEQIEKVALRVYELLTARNERFPRERVAERRARINEADRELAAAKSKLAKILLGPISQSLGAQRLIIVPHGILQFIPFSVLPAPNFEGESNRTLAFNHEIVSLPSASVLAALSRDRKGRTPASRQLAVIADPVFSRSDERLAKMFQTVEPASKGGLGQELSLPRLFTSRFEANQILSLVPRLDRIAALDFAANHAFASSPELSHYRLIHFSTHAIIDNTHPELSAIALTMIDKKGKSQPGFLRAHEIFKLKLPADLVVLSACRTGLGRDFNGEGLISLTRAFMYAGAARVVVSLWSVDDRATAELMVRFYRKMLGPRPLPPAAALRMAQVEMASDPRWESPYFWGAFVIQGEFK